MVQVAVDRSADLSMYTIVLSMDTRWRVATRPSLSRISKGSQLRRSSRALRDVALSQLLSALAGSVSLRDMDSRVVYSIVDWPLSHLLGLIPILVANVFEPCRC